MSLCTDVMKFIFDSIQTLKFLQLM